MAMKCKARCWKVALMVLVGIAVMGAAVMLLWNWLMPALFAGAGRIDYLQAMGLLVLSRLLFGGFRGRGCHGRWRHRHCGKMGLEGSGSDMHDCCADPQVEAETAKDA